MKLIYREALSPDVVEGVVNMLKKYPCVVEIDPIDWQGFWDAFLDWADAALPKYTITINSGSSGENYQTDRVLYGIVDRGNQSNEHFMFFKTKHEKELFTKRFQRVLKSSEPFQTILEV